MQDEQCPVVSGLLHGLLVKFNFGECSVMRESQCSQLQPLQCPFPSQTWQASDSVMKMFPNKTVLKTV